LAGRKEEGGVRPCKIIFFEGLSVKSRGKTRPLCKDGRKKLVNRKGGFLESGADNEDGGIAQIKSASHHCTGRRHPFGYGWEVREKKIMGKEIDECGGPIAISEEKSE